MRPSFGANLPQIVKYIWQKAFFKHALATAKAGDDFPFRTPQFHPAKISQRFWKVLGKVFENIKCACPQKTGNRKCIVSSIYMIRQFIFVGVIFPGGDRAFFDKSMTVGFCRYALCFMAATSFSRRICWRLWRHSFSEDRKKRQPWFIQSRRW